MDRLEAEHLTKSFQRAGGIFARRGDTVAAVDDVSLRVQPGEKVGIVGESGSGKTTLGRILLGLLPPDRGSVRFAGKDLYAAAGPERQALRRRIQMIFQDNAGALDPRLRIGDAVAEPLRAHGLGGDRRGRRAIVREWLEKVGLDDSLMRRFPHALSGGQRQRVGIARALVVAPELVIADEPVASLDVSIQTQILQLLADLVRETGVALLFITHDLRVVRALTDRLLVMRRGRVVETGPTARVIRQPEHPYTQALTAAIPALHPDHRRLLAGQSQPAAN